jgi:hypothetical protein
MENTGAGSWVGERFARLSSQSLLICEGKQRALFLLLPERRRRAPWPCA